MLPWQPMFVMIAPVTLDLNEFHENKQPAEAQ